MESNCDDQVHELLIRFTSAFLDQGFAPWGIPNRDAGYFQCFVRLFADNPPWAQRWLKPFRQMVIDEKLDTINPTASIIRSLREMGVAEHDWDRFIEKTLLALPGWAGMVQQLATNASWALRPAPRETLEQFLAVRLLLDRLSATDFINSHSSLRGFTLPQTIACKDPDDSRQISFVRLSTSVSVLPNGSANGMECKDAVRLDYGSLATSERRTCRV